MGLKKAACSKCHFVRNFYLKIQQYLIVTSAFFTWYFLVDRRAVNTPVAKGMPLGSLSSDPRRLVSDIVLLPSDLAVGHEY